MKQWNWKSVLLTISDIMFVLILCFVVLLTTMLLTKSESGTTVTGYQIQIPLLVGVIISLVGYLCFVIKTSTNMLRELINYFFSNQESNEGGNKK